VQGDELGHAGHQALHAQHRGLHAGQQHLLGVAQPLPDVELVGQPADADIVLAFGDDLEQLELRIADVESASSAAHLWVMYPKDADIDLGAFEAVAERNGFEVGARESLDATWEALHLVR